MKSLRETTAAPEASAFGEWWEAERIREDFPLLKRQVHGQPLVYLDNAATSQKPQIVIDALVQYYTAQNSNIHRGVHSLSQEATDAYEQTRRKVQRFVNAGDWREIVFVRGTTEAINLVAQTYGRQHIRSGDEVVISNLEHHSNIVPWQMLCEQQGAKLRVIPINDQGEILLEDYASLLGDRTRLVAITHVSNALGTITPVRQMIQMAQQRDIPVLVDGAQAAPHMKVDVQQLGCDFYAFSGHKIYGPTGIGVLYGRSKWLQSLPPYQGGGEMIRSVTFEKTTYNTVPHKFEAGTPNIAGSIALGTAIDYISGLGLDKVAAYEHELLEYATEVLSQIPALRLIGTARNKSSLVSFTLGSVHPHDIGTILDQQGIAVRTGHHCAQPVMDRFGVSATVRASLAFYNTRKEIDRLAEALHKAAKVFS